MSYRNKAIDVGAWMLENGHRAMLKVTGGRYPRTVMGMTPVELHTIGRKTGQRRSTLLTLCRWPLRLRNIGPSLLRSVRSL